MSASWKATENAPASRPGPFERVVERLAVVRIMEGVAAMKGWTVLIGVLLVGAALGVVGTLRLPSLAAPYLHYSGLAAPANVVEGRVTKKVREQGRVLARIELDHGVVLATFTNKASEIDLLLQEGDRVRLALSDTRPFAEDPTIDSAMLIPLLLMGAGFTAFFVTALILRVRAELTWRKLRVLRAARLQA